MNKFILAAAISLIIAVLYNQVLSGKKIFAEELKVELLHLDSATGPESIVFDSNGEGPYVGVSDGRILKWQGKEQGWLEYAAVSSPELLSRCRGSTDPNTEHLCGRPLGFAFSKEGDLYIADAYLGLVLVRHGEKFGMPLTEGLQLGFTNGVCIDETGAVYFTDSSRNFQRRQFLSTVVSGDKTGRLMKYDPNTKEVQVLLDNLQFPNGVVLSKDGSFILFTETTTCRVMRYWLQTPKAGQVELFAQLPGFPDNIKRSPRGGVWVAMHSKRTTLVQLLLSIPWVRRVMQPWGPQIQELSTILHKLGGGALALRLSEDGKVLELLEGFGGNKLRFISEVEEKNGSLWIGSVLMPFVAIYHH